MRADSFLRYVLLSALLAITPSPVTLPASAAEAVVPIANSHDHLTNAPRADLSIAVREIPDWRPGYTLFVLPGQTLTLSTRVPGGAAYRWSGDGRFVLPTNVKSRAATTGRMGAVLPAGSDVVWKAPAAVGGSILVLRTATQGEWKETLHIDVQVMAPFTSLANGLLNGYRIGRYPAAKTKRHAPTADYTPPPGFLKLPELAARPIKVSPRFFLDDFVCKQDGRGDRYVALEPELLRFLEAITDRVEQEGFRCSVAESEGSLIQLANMEQDGSSVAEAMSGRRISVAPEAPGRPILIMSGYRTPHYNRSLGNVRMSRHQFGDAADIIVDSDGDQVMDDLNQDGILNGQDAITLAAWIDDLWQNEEHVSRPGGLGVYNAEGDHGPFVHVDVRGVRARWSGNGLKWKAADESGNDAGSESEPKVKPKAKTIVVR